LSEEKKDAGSKDTPPENQTAKMAVDAALAKIKLLEDAVKDRDKTIADLTVQLKAANDVLEAQQREELMAYIQPRSKLTIEDLATKSLEELQNIRATIDQVKMPTYKNIHFGPIGADEKEDEGLTVGDLSVVTAAKRKTNSCNAIMQLEYTYGSKVSRSAYSEKHALNQ
jgi:predicted secreted protein